MLEPGCRSVAGASPVCYLFLESIVFSHIPLLMFVGFLSANLLVSAPHFALFGVDEIFSCKSIFMY